MFRIKILFTAREFEASLKYKVDKPFITLNPRYLDNMVKEKNNFVLIFNFKTINEEGKLEIEPGTRLKALVEYCKNEGLEFPFFLKEDLNKPIWKIVNENSLTFNNLLSNITKTEAILPNGDTLFSSPDNTVAKKAFDIKSIILTENENFCFVNKYEFEFDKVERSFRKKIVLESDKDGYNIKDFDDLLNNFLKDWSNETKVNVVHHRDGGIVERILKFSCKNSRKVSQNS